MIFKRAFAIPTLWIIGLVIVGAFIVVGGGFNIASITGSGSYIERPVFYYDKCEATGSYDYSTPYQLATSGQWLNAPSVTNKYDVKFQTTHNLDSTHRIEYYVCNSKTINDANCRIPSTPVSKGGDVVKSIKEINDIRPNEVVWAQYQKWSFFKWVEDTGATYQIGFIPYGINQYNVLGGSSKPIVANSCTYPTTQRDTILGTNSEKIKVYIDVGTNERTLQPEERRWYIAGYLTSASPSFALTYKNQDAWCRPTGTSGEIYKINSVTTAGGTYKVASADWSDYLGTETCCPAQTRGDEVCSNSFKWELVQGSECSAFKPCGSSDWVPYNSGEIIKYSCVNGFCESETQEVECASNFDCIDTNEVCDLNSYECVNANVNLQGQTIITLPDSEYACQQEGGVWVSETSEKKSFFNILGFGTPKVVVEEYCDLNSKSKWWIWLIVGVGVLFLLGFGKKIIIGIRTLFRRIF